MNISHFIVCLKTFNYDDLLAETVKNYRLTKNILCLKIVITIYLLGNVQHLSTCNKIVRR